MVGRGATTIGLLAGLGWLLLLQAQTSFAASPFRLPERPVRVTVYPLKPSAFVEDGRLQGMSIEVWQQIEQLLEIKTRFSTVRLVDDSFAAVQSGQSDADISLVPLASDLEVKFDFSTPVLSSGLQVLVPARPSYRPFRRLLAALLSRDFLELTAASALAVLLPAHLVWWVERRKPTDFLGDRSYLTGIGKTIWWAFGTLATQADEMPKTAVGRIVALFWMFIGVLYVGFYTATITNVLSEQQARDDIAAAADLPGRLVGVIAGSPAAAYLQTKQIRTIEYARLELACEGMLAGQVDAVVADALALRYYANFAGKGKVQTVGEIFERRDLGYLLQNNSPYRKPVSWALLKLKENGTYRQIHQKWLGDLP
ncbi:MAG: transporter substrate-binding domain-containing protein [Aphanocapsa lilacina HA4352-LM1]|nr:transporter substrate-binding domain-containing protein [Aphanocapsa lilacina HA4352-LM1]